MGKSMKVHARTGTWEGSWLPVPFFPWGVARNNPVHGGGHPGLHPWPKKGRALILCSHMKVLGKSVMDSELRAGRRMACKQSVAVTGINGAQGWQREGMVWQGDGLTGTHHQTGPPPRSPPPSSLGTVRGKRWGWPGAAGSPGTEDGRAALWTGSPLMQETPNSGGA